MGLISEKEQRRRREIVESVIGTNAMEGLFLDAPTLAIMEQFKDGAIEIEELSLAIDRHVQKMIASIQASDITKQTTVNAA